MITSLISSVLLFNIGISDWMVLTQCLSVYICGLYLWHIAQKHNQLTLSNLKGCFVWISLVTLFAILAFWMSKMNVAAWLQWTFFVLYAVAVVASLVGVSRLVNTESVNEQTAVAEEEAQQVMANADEASQQVVVATDNPQQVVVAEENPLPEAVAKEIPQPEVVSEQVKSDGNAAEAEYDEVPQQDVVAEEDADDANATGQIPEGLVAAMHKLMEEDLYYLNPDINIDDMAQTLCTNRTYVTRLMRQEYGLSFIEYVNVARIQYSQKLLYTSPDMTLEDVAAKSGFQSSSNYCRAFKRYTGSTPKGWLQQAH